MPFQARRMPEPASSASPLTVMFASVEVILPRVLSIVHSISPIP